MRVEGLLFRHYFLEKCLVVFLFIFKLDDDLLMRFLLLDPVHEDRLALVD